MISFVQSNANGGAATVTLDGVAAGNLIVVGFSEVKDASPTTLSCSDGTSTLQAVSESNGTFVRWRFFYLLSANSGNRTYTVSGANGSVQSTIVMEFSYTGSLSLEDSSNNYADDTTSVSSNNVQPSGYSLVLGGVYSYGGGDYSSCQINSVAYGGIKSYSDLASWPPMWYRIVTSGFDGAATCTTSTAGYYAASAISFREQTITITRVVDPDMGSGYNYDSLSDWEADLGGTTSGDLPLDNEIAIAKCRCTGGTADGTGVEIDGWTTDVTHYIKVWTDTAESYRHAGKWGTGNKYRIDGGTTGTPMCCIAIMEDFTRLDGLQLGTNLTDRTATWESLSVAWQPTPAETVVATLHLSNCILYMHGNPAADFSAEAMYGLIVRQGQASTTVSPTAYVWNNVFHSTSIYNGTTKTGIAIRCEHRPSTTRAYNNTIAGWYTGLSARDNDDSQNYLHSRNTIIYDCTVRTDGLTQARHDYNATNAASLEYTANTHDHVSHTFSFVDAANGDFHLQSTDMGAKGLGLNLYNDANYPFQTDIDGQDRGGSGAQWDIGADELFTLIQEGFRFRNDNGSETTASWLAAQDTNIYME